MVIFLSGCLNSSLILFTGESKNWSASYAVTNLNGEYHTNTLTLTYKGDNPSEVGKVKYKFSAGPNGGSGETELSEHKEIIHKSGGNGAVAQKDEIINVTVEWENIEEELQLSTNGKR
ncbi:hypothetical protein [Paenibacillus azoreducens]|uniref:Uncharacterized protein n=1 Tax=Paenibacillus azoreducens TaxID=116718 RepID=A0A920CS07_9BACL|nr:hypothetical protein [Paenibacillus azoreducens]GIO46948.1 hypothetical protein J34TS1_17130 [Paenibacillus azoreducens]